MNLNKEDPIYKKAQGWSPEEHKTLVQITNEQIQLEEQDCSRIISWSDHWENVSSYLKKKGHSRTHHACKNYWHRVAKFEVEAIGMRHGSSVSSDSSDTARSASNSLDDPRSNKRGLSQDMDICSEGGNTRPCKKSRAGVIVGQEAFESSRVSLDFIYLGATTTDRKLTAVIRLLHESYRSGVLRTNIREKLGPVDTVTDAKLESRGSATPASRTCERWTKPTLYPQVPRLSDARTGQDTDRPTDRLRASRVKQESLVPQTHRDL